MQQNVTHFLTNVVELNIKKIFSIFYCGLWD